MVFNQRTVRFIDASQQWPEVRSGAANAHEQNDVSSVNIKQDGGYFGLTRRAGRRGEAVVFAFLALPSALLGFRAQKGA
ncbi:MAG: hypothetical protein CL583_11580 [Alteromonadaceae bacterium]|nr:hypothetical protein [Alteromonadaceae bacterium]|tara:strand:+ start:545 stop:781 length:237 start_codon:yes stop_codon:yes gene_type:complete